MTTAGREPFRNKRTVWRNLRAGDLLHLVHHQIPGNTRVARVLSVSRWQLVVTPPPGVEEERSLIEWPRAVTFRIDGPRTFTLTHAVPNGRVADMTLTLL